MTTDTARGVRLLTAAVAVIVSGAVRVRAADLDPAVERGWTAYVTAVERRIAGELSATSGFLALDRESQGVEHRSVVLKGDVPIHRLAATDAAGRELTVPSATVQHWRGAVFVPGASLQAMIRELQNAPPTWQEDVLSGAVLKRDGDRMTVYLKLQRHKLVTVVYNTEHEVAFREHGATREMSSSRSTKIAEMEDVGTPKERELVAGADHGFLWRLNAYWRYEQVAGGVIAECESISLSRPVPRLLRPLVMPIAEDTARESMERTLVAFRTHFSHNARTR
jgi:hypothetical protein